MKWSTIKVFFTKIFVFLKHYWYVPFFFVFNIMIYVIQDFYKNDDNLEKSSKILKLNKESYEKQINVIEEAHKEETERKEENRKRYEEVVKLIDEKYKAKNEKLNRSKKKRIKKLVEDWNKDPKTLNDILGVMYGIDYVETNEENTDNHSDS